MLNRSLRQSMLIQRGKSAIGGILSGTLELICFLFLLFFFFIHFNKHSYYHLAGLIKFSPFFFVKNPAVFLSLLLFFFFNLLSYVYVTLSRVI